jgi:hypothetical protein
MVDIEKLLAELTLEEKVSLLAGVDTWRTYPIPRLNIPSVKVHIDLPSRKTMYTILIQFTQRCRMVLTELEEVILLIASPPPASPPVLLLAPLLTPILSKKSVMPSARISRPNLRK